jgi:hypothetical protein
MPQFDEAFHINTYLTTLFGIFVTVFGDSEESSDDYEQEDWDFSLDERPLVTTEFASLFAVANIYISNIFSLISSSTWEIYLALVPVLKLEAERLKIFVNNAINAEFCIQTTLFKAFYTLIRTINLFFLLFSRSFLFIIRMFPFEHKLFLRVSSYERSLYKSIYSFDPHFIRFLNIFVGELPFHGLTFQFDDMYTNFLNSTTFAPSGQILCYNEFCYALADFYDELDFYAPNRRPYYDYMRKIVHKDDEAMVNDHIQEGVDADPFKKIPGTFFV